MFLVRIEGVLTSLVTNYCYNILTDKYQTIGTPIDDCKRMRTESEGVGCVCVKNTPRASRVLIHIGLLHIISNF